MRPMFSLREGALFFACSILLVRKSRLLVVWCKSCGKKLTLWGRARGGAFWQFSSPFFFNSITPPILLGRNSLASNMCRPGSRLHEQHTLPSIVRRTITIPTSGEKGRKMGSSSTLIHFHSPPPKPAREGRSPKRLTTVE